MDPFVECPCKRFQSPTGLFEALKATPESDGSKSNELSELLDWISSGLHHHKDIDDEAAATSDTSSTRQTFECTPTHGRCRNRVDCAIVVLNSVRQACRPFLDQLATSPDKKSPLDTKRSMEKVNLGSQVEFPSLRQPIEKKSVQQKTKKERKRIRPVIVAASSTTPWNLGTRSQGNLVNISSTEEPTSADFMNLRSKKEMRSASAWQDSSFGPDTSDKHEDVPSPESIDVWHQNESEEVLKKDVVLNNLAELYSLLMDSCLVPSSFDEVHLLIALLSCKETTAKPGLFKNQTPFSESIRSIGRCRFFATKVLQTQSSLLVQMVPFVPKLVDCITLKDAIPDLSVELNEALDCYETQRSAGFTRLSSQQSALLTLPFQSARDSRHNFKTAKQQRAYKNREDTRDAFLYQLRTFLDIRGKILDANQSQKAIERIKQSANGIASDVQASNLPWFAEFFTEMLIQLGNVPIQETDTEVLKIADKERLNALHRRFSTKTGSKKTPTQKLSISQKNDESPFKAAQRYFTHHQEFFYLFVTSADSHTFTVHLRAALVGISRQQLLGSLTVGLDTLCILGRFLGMIVFSSNWKQPLEDPNERLQHDFALDGLHLLGSCGLLLPNLLKSPTLHSTFFAMELLSMAKWDYLAHLSPTYCQTARILRSIQHQTRRYRNSALYLSIEHLFEEFCGLALGATMRDNVPNIEIEGTYIHLWTHLDSRVEELQSLIDDIGSLGSPRNSSASRKLRPSTIEKERAPQLVDDFLTAGNTGNGFDFPIIERDSFLSRLGDSFFHQHAGLKLICEFSINQTLSYVESHAHANCFEEVKSQSATTQEQLAQLHMVLTKRGLDFLSNQLKEQTRGVLVALCPSLEAAIVDTAVSLSHYAGASSGASMISRLVAQEIERRKQVLMRAIKKSMIAKNEQCNHADHQVTTVLANTLLHVADILQDVPDETTTRTVQESLSSVRSIVATSPALKNQCSKDSDYRHLFSTIYHFLKHLRTMGRIIADMDPNNPDRCSLEMFFNGCLIAFSIGSFSKQSGQILRGMLVETPVEKLKELAISLDMTPSFHEFSRGMVNSRQCKD